MTVRTEEFIKEKTIRFQRRKWKKATKRKKTITVQKKERKHALDQESKIQEKNDNDQERKKEGRKWKTQISG